jgi:hypothetical protein
MSYKKLVIPIGTALAALIASASEASIIPADSQKDLSELQGETSRANTKSTDPILQRLTYQIREQAHTLTLHRSSAGVLYAGHASHSSHASHASHASHRSGR